MFFIGFISGCLFMTVLLIGFIGLSYSLRRMLIEDEGIGDD